MLCQWLESEAGAISYTLTELHDKMKEISDNSEINTIKRLKQKLQEHYKEFIFFAEVEGYSNVLCFKNMAKYIKMALEEESQYRGGSILLERFVFLLAWLLLLYTYMEQW